MSRTAVRLVIFDCDGVLVDSEPLAMQVLLQAVAETGTTIDVASGYQSFLGKSLSTVCDILRQEYGVDLGLVTLERMRARLYRLFRQELQPIPGIATALETIRIPFCVASSSQIERIRLTLDVAGLATYFGNRIYSASMVSFGKPAPDLFLHAADRMGVAPANCVVIEDSPAGVRAATCAGMRTLAFTGGTHARSLAHRQSLEALNPLAIFDDMLQLSDLLQGLDARREDDG